VSSGGSGRGYLNHTALADCLSSVENVTEKTQSRLDEILTEAAYIQKKHCPLNKHLHNMGLIDEPIACGMDDESAFHLLCDCPSLISLRVSTFSKPILSV
jgi:hypothetical protein